MDHNFFMLLIAVIPQIYAYAQESANASGSDDKIFAMSALRSLISLGFLVGPLGGTFIWGAAGYKGLLCGSTHWLLLKIPRQALRLTGSLLIRIASRSASPSGISIVNVHPGFPFKEA